MTAHEADRSELVVAYLLGELDGPERARFEQRLAVEPELKAELEEMTPVVVRLEALPEDAWDAPEPPPLALPVSELPAAAAEQTDRSRWSRRFHRPAIAAAVVCLAAIAAVWVVVGGLGDDESGGERILLAPLTSSPEPARGELTLEPDSSEQALLRVAGLDASDGSFYEIWLLGKDDRLLSLGSFRVGESGAAKLELQLPVEASSYDYFDVSLEPDDGNPGHSGDSVLRGATVS